MSRDFFRAAARSGEKTDTDNLEPGILRFTLIFKQKPDVEAVRAQCERYLGPEQEECEIVR
ncbi:hypothetical protein B5K06_26140 [Rhizobium grahamii]|uniref:Uncharacterized protein n=1 Tax=Rhizobium grahamii TaxID=1120045 RepID=A0A370KHR6_9HYPH|nr:hypothetical protein B5K06_26140 [Rhizobium grahamii]